MTLQSAIARTVTVIAGILVCIVISLPICDIRGILQYF